MKSPLWEGVYKNFAEVPVLGPGFAGGDWLKNSTAKLANFKTLADDETSVPSVTGYTDSLLPVIASIVQGRKRSVRIIDFGGGLGFSYYQVSAGLASTVDLEFHVVDIEEVCAEGRHLFRNEPNIKFHSSLSEVQDLKFDIVHIGSSLQYIENWQEQLAQLCSVDPEYVLMANIPAGDIETFATAQNYYGSRIACWFFDVADLARTMQEIGFSMIFKCSYFIKVYGVEQPYPLENFDEEHRISYPCMLLFQNESK